MLPFFCSEFYFWCGGILALADKYMRLLQERTYLTYAGKKGWGRFGRDVAKDDGRRNVNKQPYTHQTGECFREGTPLVLSEE